MCVCGFLLFLYIYFWAEWPDQTGTVSLDKIPKMRKTFHRPRNLISPHEQGRCPASSIHDLQTTRSRSICSRQPKNRLTCGPNTLIISRSSFAPTWPDVTTNHLAAAVVVEYVYIGGAGYLSRARLIHANLSKMYPRGNPNWPKYLLHNFEARPQRISRPVPAR